MSEEIKLGVMVGFNFPSPPPDSKYRIHDFSEDLVPEIITNKKNIDGMDYFLIKWEDVEEPSYVEDSIVKEKYKSLCIDFHQRHIKWANIL